MKDTSIKKCSLYVIAPSLHSIVRASFTKLYHITAVAEVTLVCVISGGDCTTHHWECYTWHSFYSYLLFIFLVFCFFSVSFFGLFRFWLLPPWTRLLRFAVASCTIWTSSPVPDIDRSPKTFFWSPKIHNDKHYTGSYCNVTYQTSDGNTRSAHGPHIWELPCLAGVR